MTFDLTLAEQTKLETLIDESVTARFVGGEVERCTGGHRPVGASSVEDVRELLEGLWGAILTEATIEDAFLRLAECGAKWPGGICEQDERESYEEAKLLEAYGDYLVAEMKL